MSYNLTAAASSATLPLLNSIKTINYSPKLTNNKTPNTLNGTNSKNDSNLSVQFKAACEVIQNLPKNGPFQPSNELLLKFYGYFKQATNGPCNTSKPSVFKVVERAKWDAWHSVRKLSKNEAMQGYIDEIKNIIETMPHNDFVQKLCEVIGPFYEYVNEQDDVSSSDEELTKTNGKSTHLNGLELIKETNNNVITLNGNCLNNFINHNGLNRNGDLNPETNSIQSDEEEDFCDTTSEFISEQDVLIQNIKKQLSNKDQNKTDETNSILNTSFREEYTNGYETSDKNNNDSSPLINKLGGEMNSPPQGSTASAYAPIQQSQSIRQSRPGSSQSVSYSGRQISLNQTGGSGGYPPNENYLNSNYIAQDTNRQMLLILLRLQQDTNNVITRLSYLEANVMSLTNSLQMNRIENSIQMNNQVSSAFSLVNSSPQGGGGRVGNNGSNRAFSAGLYNWFRDIDWKTVTIALLWPFVIRLVFYLFRKIRLVVKFKRIRQEFGPKF